jgi:hypothetical protein
MSHEVSFTTVDNTHYMDIWKDSYTSIKPHEETQKTEESGKPVQLMLHDIKASALNSSLANRVISKSELNRECFMPGVLENSSIHSPVFISDIRPEYRYSELDQMIPTRMSKFTSPDENNLSDEWTRHDCRLDILEEHVIRQQSWTEWALGLIGMK